MPTSATGPRFLHRAVPATEEDWATEYMGLDLAVGVVDDLDDALEHIRRWTTRHTESIVTNDLARAERFIAEVDSAAVIVNASTRFTDGGELGLGAEVGHLHPEAARPRPDGPDRAHHHQVDRAGRGPGPRVATR